MRKITLILAFTVVTATLAMAQTAQDIINKYYENTGGLDNWKKLNGAKYSGKVSVQGMELPVEMLNLKSGKSFFKIDVQGKEFVQQAFDGSIVWGHNMATMEPEKRDNETTENVKRESKDFPDAFCDYKKNGYQVELLGKETVEGTECFKLKLIKTPLLVDGKEVENVVFYFMDAENYVPVLSETEIKSGQGKGMVSQILFSDYKEVNGLFFPFSMTFKAKGQPQGQTVNFTSIELDPKVDESIFSYKGN